MGGFSSNGGTVTEPTHSHPARDGIPDVAMLKHKVVAAVRAIEAQVHSVS